MSPKVLVLDFESTRDIEHVSVIRPTDLGAVLVSVERRSILQAISTLFPLAANEMRQKRCRISVGLTREVPNPDPAIAMFSAMMEQCDWVMSHGIFDSQFCCGLEHHYLPRSDRMWIDTLTTDWGDGLETGRSLKDKCRRHNVTNVCPHRALPDALALAQCLCRDGNLRRVIERGIPYTPDPRRTRNF